MTAHTFTRTRTYTYKHTHTHTSEHEAMNNYLTSTSKYVNSHLYTHERVHTDTSKYIVSILFNWQFYYILFYSIIYNSRFCVYIIHSLLQTYPADDPLRVKQLFRNMLWVSGIQLYIVSYIHSELGWIWAPIRAGCFSPNSFLLLTNSQWSCRS